MSFFDSFNSRKNYPTPAGVAFSEYQAKVDAEEDRREEEITERQFQQKDRELDLREREVKVMEEEATNSKRMISLLEEIKEISKESLKILKRLDKGDTK